MLGRLYGLIVRVRPLMKLLIILTDCWLRHSRCANIENVSNIQPADDNDLSTRRLC